MSRDLDSLNADLLYNDNDDSVCSCVKFCLRKHNISDSQPIHHIPLFFYMVTCKAACSMVTENVFSVQSKVFIENLCCNYFQSVSDCFDSTVKRRSHGCEVTPTKMSPVLDTEANFEVCFVIECFLNALS